MQTDLKYHKTHYILILQIYLDTLALAEIKLNMQIFLHENLRPEFTVRFMKLKCVFHFAMKTVKALLRLKLLEKRKKVFSSGVGHDLSQVLVYVLLFCVKRVGKK